MNYEEEIRDYVQQHPGCNRTDLAIAIAHASAGIVADRMVSNGKLDRWYSYGLSYFYIPGTYTPPHLREPEAEMRELIPLAAGLHRDGTIHIYVNEEDSGLSVGLLEDETLHVMVAGSKWAMVAGKA